MAETIDTWCKEHGNFARLLGLLEAQIRLFHAGQAPDYELMHDIVYYMTHYPDLVHHPKEDMVYEKVSEIDAGARPVVEKLMSQHIVLRDSGAKLLENLEAILAGGMLARASVETPGETYIAYFRDHMRQEESEIFPLAMKLLSDEDWDVVKAAMRFPADPLFGESVEQRYRALHRRIAGEAGCGCSE